MNTISIEITQTPDPKDSKHISQGIVNFNQAMIPDLEPIEAEVKFFAFARNQEGEVIGGIRATCYWNTLHIKLLWLDQNYRGQGMGQQLLKQTEQFAPKHDCQKALVETTSWQAKPFYEKAGYNHIATINDRPKGHVSHYLTKELD
ncbi:GNAT family N-acetyltransferase [Myroides pelagicus]|uniref:GNAT family N-acetyltransferase n=1 Tax=Myroides pelagicus TaxID=270914 RepID=A0A7K1GQS0_9FLAO|nr:GNAT family N-acetyltransferase [Myroides pelagicus]MTH31078.1 GNAT family N-acetyltransferase [Myroides pelagicus]